MYDVKRPNMTAAIRPDWSLWMKVRNFKDLDVRRPSNVDLYDVKRLNMTAAITPDWSLWMKVMNFEDFRRQAAVKRSFVRRQTSKYDSC